jgi:hypothetical protein
MAGGGARHRVSAFRDDTVQEGDVDVVSNNAGRKLSAAGLVATWCEKDELFGAERVYCHLFFGLGDGGALAFFKFAKPEDQELFGPKMPDTPFHHIALNVDGETQQALEKRLAAAGYKEPQTYVLEHGYCRSVYMCADASR